MNIAHRSNKSVFVSVECIRLHSTVLTLKQCMCLSLAVHIIILPNDGSDVWSKFIQGNHMLGEGEV